MDLNRWANLLEKEFYGWGSFNAYPREPRRYIEVLENVQGMTSPSNMHLLNLAVQCMEPGECYLEVGTWRGATLIGALLGNDAYGVAIDNDTMDEHDKDERSSQEVWRENIERFGIRGHARYVDGSVPAVWKELALPGPAGVYLFDGDKSTDDAAYAGLEGALPFLAEQALIVVDDANDTHIRRMTELLCRQYRDHAAKIFDLPTPGNCWPQWWNGVIAIAWSGRGLA